MNELVSIIMPNYNCENYLKDTIDSVISQTYTNWELLFVDDCSTDNSLELIKSYNDERIKILKNEIHSGAAISRNYALREARGKWIAFLDSDDIWLPEKLEKQIMFMEENDYKFSYTNYRRIDEENNDLGVEITGPKKITKRKMYHYCYPGCLTVMFDADFVGLVQIEDLPKNNDYAMWLKICKKATCYLLNESLAKYRQRVGSISRQSKLSLIKYHYKLFRVSEKMGVISSIWRTFMNLFFGVIKKIKYTKREGK